MISPLLYSTSLSLSLRLSVSLDLPFCLSLSLDLSLSLTRSLYLSLALSRDLSLFLSTHEFLIFLFQVISDSEEDVPLASIKRIRDLVEFKRRKAEQMKAERLAKRTTLQHEIVDDEQQPIINTEQAPVTPRKAAEKAVRDINEILVDESGTWDDSDADPDYFPETIKRKRSSSEQQHLLHPLLIQDPEAEIDIGESVTTGANNYHNIESSNSRKKQKMTKSERQGAYLAKRKHKIETYYAIKPGCAENCKRVKRCIDTFSDNDRLYINKYFWSLEYPNRRTFILERVNKCCIERRRVENEKKRKDNSFKYTLKLEDGSVHVVCKSFFLGTLGLNEKNDNIITRTFKELEAADAMAHEQDESLRPSLFADRRGEKSTKGADECSVKRFIERYNPVISHYSREKTPNKRYLPNDVTVKRMHQEYISTYDNISYSTFYRMFKTMNISITSLGNEECETCEKYRLHKAICNCENVCDIKVYMSHKRKYRAAREEYQKDSTDKVNYPTDVRISADLQKVIMLPKIDQFKECVFTPRLVVFNETFSELGKKGRDVAVCWHEGISGRKDEDISSAFYKFICSLRDTKHLTLWLDNCSGQNKNWTFYSMLIYIVNADYHSVDEIKLKYFEPGHTFMASDAAHGRIERQIRKTGKIYDFPDFIETVKRSKCEALEMNFSDFREWKSGTTQYTLTKLGDKRPYLSNLVSARFVKGCEDLLYKTSFNKNEVRVNFFKKYFTLSDTCGRQRMALRGIEPKKKAEILEKLLPLMPENRHFFWKSIPINIRADDLIVKI